MRRAAGLSLLLIGLLAVGARADAPQSSPIPVPRPGVGAPATDLAAPERPGQAAGISLGAPPLETQPDAQPEGQPLASSGVGMTRSILPRARPAGVVAAGVVAAEAPDAANQPAAPKPQAALASTSAAAVVPEPRQRKGLFGFLKAGGTRTQPDPGAIVGRAGSVCGIAAIKGKSLPPIASKVRGCGISDPVEVTSVDGIGLDPPATLDCPTAVALNTWVHVSVKPAFANKGARLTALRVAGSYECRTRNHVAGARISEHGRGKAIDISGFLLASGGELSVRGDYRRGSFARTLKAIHKAACGPFGTTLGPGSDGMHEDHLHMDTASYRSGPYCK